MSMDNDVGSRTFQELEARVRALALKIHELKAFRDTFTSMIDGIDEIVSDGEPELLIVEE